MTISFNIECEDCNKKYRVRYGLGNNFPQLASFQCYDCSKQIETGYDSYGADKILRGAIETTDEGPHHPDFQIINLHPEIPTKKGDENDPFHFQTLGIFDNIPGTEEGIREFQQEQLVWSKFNGKWKKVEKPLRILSTKDLEKLREICGINYPNFTQLFNEWMSIFISGKQETDFENVSDEYNSIDARSLKVYVKTQDKFLKQINEFCNTYMKYSEQFQSTVFHQKFGWEITDDMIANINWDDINTVYGDLYEIIGDFYVIPTMINNLKQGRAYDEFQTAGFTLAKYLKTDKANRALNFADNENLSPMSNAYHSWLRNGTHHKNSFLDIETYEVSLGTSKGGTIEKKISVIDYIKNCNELFGVGLIISSLILELRK